MKISNKQKAILKAYFKGVLVSFLTFIASNELGFDPTVSVILAALAHPAVKALDKADNVLSVLSTALAIVSFMISVERLIAPLGLPVANLCPFVNPILIPII